MKKYSSNRAQKGKTAYRTPSRWLAGRPEAFKRRENTKIMRGMQKSNFPPGNKNSNV